MFPKFNIKYFNTLNLATEFHDWKKLKYFVGINFTDDKTYDYISQEFNFADNSQICQL